MTTALELFSWLHPEDVDVLFAMGTERPLRAGEVLIVAGEPPPAIYLVLAGSLAALTPTDDGEVAGTILAGEVIGEAAFLDRSPASMTVAAVEHCAVLELATADLRAAIAADSSFGQRVTAALGATLSLRKRRQDESRQSGNRRLAPDPVARARAARIAAANISRLRGRQNHPSLLLTNRESYVAVVDHGLPRVSSPASIVVIGAGLAGLAAAAELHRAGHEVVVIEASRRIGGRCYTLRAPFAPGQFGEAGAMRFPSSHELLFAYLRRFGIVSREFQAFNPNGLFVSDGTARTIGSALAEPASAASNVRRRWSESIEPLVRRFRAAEQAGGNAWPALVEEFNEATLRDFLVESGWSEEEISDIGLVGLGMGGYGSLMQMGFLELFRLSLLGTDDGLHEIVGGADQLPNALAATAGPAGDSLLSKVRFGAQLRAIHQSHSGVRLRVQTVTDEELVEADYALVTVPFPLLRFIEAEPRFSSGKRRAINELHYFAATKIFLQFRTRFWERGPRSCEGMIVSDLPIRATYLPSSAATGSDGRCVVLASYTWEAEARVWESLTPDDRIREALRQLTTIFPTAGHDFEVGASVTWHDPSLFAGGAFAQYAPGQRGVLYNDIKTPEGRVHFAGEHTSFEHGWLEGAIESGLREAVALYERAAREVAAGAPRTPRIAPG